MVAWTMVIVGGDSEYNSGYNLDIIILDIIWMIEGTVYADVLNIWYERGVRDDSKVLS